MGLFGSSNSSPAEELASHARGSTVTADRLTTTGKRLGQDHLDGKPLIELLDADEQPHYYFYNKSIGFSRDGDEVGGSVKGGYISICLITNQRILLITEGSMGGAIQYGSIERVETNSGYTQNRLSVFTSEHEYEIIIERKIDFDEIKQAADYIREHEAETPSNADEFVKIENIQNPWQNSVISADEGMATEPLGNYVTEERFDKINDILDPDEVVHYITRGTTVDVEGSGAGTSLFGDDRSRKSGTSGYVRAVMTDKRVAIKVPQVLGDDERSIPYDSITSVDLDTGLTFKRMTLQTPGSTYHIEAQEPGKEEVREVVSFIRDERRKANQTEVVSTEDSSEPDPLEQLDKLKELHEKGAVSDNEFEEKKSDLLDKI